MVKCLKYENAKSIIHGFTEIVNKSKPKPNKLQIDQEKQFYNRLMLKWLDDNDILMDLEHNKENLA